MRLTTEQVARRNHQLSSNLLSKEISQHWLIFFDVESFVDKETGVNHPRLICSEFILTDRNFETIESRKLSFLWEEVDKFVKLVLAKTKMKNCDSTLFAHYAFYDLFVSAYEEIIDDYSTDDFETLYKAREYLKIHKNSIFDKIIGNGYSLEEVSKAKTRFFKFCRPEDIRRRGKGRSLENALTIIDTMNYFKTSVKSLGDDFDLPKLNIADEEDAYGNKGFNIDIAQNAEHFEKIKAYCERDVEIIRIATLNLLQLTSANARVPYSISSAGWDLFVNTYLQKLPPIYIHDKAEMLILENDCYKGARTEVIKRGITEEVFSIDKNSLYPSEMLYNWFPIRPLSRKEDGISPFTRYAKKNYKKVPSLIYNKIKDRQDIGVCVKVIVNIPDDLLIAPLPYTLENPDVPDGKDNRLLFPTGRFTTYLCTPEFKLAYENGWLEEVHEVGYYKMYPIFTDFVLDQHEKLVDAINRGNKAQRRALKLIMNSLFGKWGQKIKKLIKVGINEDNELGITQEEIDGRMRYVNKIGTGKFVYDMYRLAYNSFPAIAAHIASYSRVEMWRAIQKVGSEEIIYIDNDGLKVTYAGMQNILDEIGDERELGKFKYEGKGKIEVLANKAYTFWSDQQEEPIHREKGIKSTSIPVDELFVKQERPVSLTDMQWAKGHSPTMSKTEIKKRALELHGRKSLEDGFTKPARIYEEVEDIFYERFENMFKRQEAILSEQKIDVENNEKKISEDIGEVD